MTPGKTYTTAKEVAGVILNTLTEYLTQVLGSPNDHRDDAKKYWLDRAILDTQVRYEIDALLQSRSDLYFQYAREQGATWNEIGNLLGITRQAAQLRFKHLLPPTKKRPPKTHPTENN